MTGSADERPAPGPGPGPGSGPSSTAFVGWTLAALAALGLAWFAAAVVLPVWRIRGEVEACSWGSDNISIFAERSVAKLGGHRRVARSLRIYRRMPDRIAPHKDTAALMLCRCGPAALDDMIGLLGHSDWRVRLTAAEALGEIGDARAAVPICALLLDEKCNYGAARALRNLPHPDAVGPLIRALACRDQSTQHCVGFALAAVGEPAVGPLIAALKHADYHVREGAAETLGDIGSAEAVRPLAELLRTDSSNWVRSSAANALAAIGGSGIDELLAVLKTPPSDWDAARPLVEACHALARTREPRAVEPLIRLLKRDDIGLSAEAAHALGAIGDRRAVEPLIDRLHDNWSMRQAAARALGELGDPRAIGPLRAMMARQDLKVPYENQVRSAAETALEELRKTPEEVQNPAGR